MLILQTDYQTITPEGDQLILRYNGKPIEEQSDALRIVSGHRVLLDDEAADWTVEAVLLFGYVPYLKKETWIARPDWDTAVRKKNQ